MHAYLILISIFSPILARPDVSQGYRYEKGGSENFIGELPFQNTQIGGGGQSFIHSQSNSGYDRFGIGSTSGIGSTIGINSGSSFDFGGGIHNQQNLQPIITKHFYLHSAPDETDQQQQVRTIHLGRAQKTYRVVFIKAPSPASQSASIQAVYPKNEEKTVIYVLSQKPDDVNIGDIATPAPSLPSKPEVFFIKYKTAEEAAHAQQQIRAQYDSLGGTSKISDEGIASVSSVIGTIGGGSSSSASYSNHGTSDFINSVTISPGQTSINSHGTYLPPSK